MGLLHIPDPGKRNNFQVCASGKYHMFCLQQRFQSQLIHERVWRLTQKEKRVTLLTRHFPNTSDYKFSPMSPSSFIWWKPRAIFAEHLVPRHHILLPLEPSLRQSVPRNRLHCPVLGPRQSSSSSFLHHTAPRSSKKCIGFRQTNQRKEFMNIFKLLSLLISFFLTGLSSSNATCLTCIYPSRFNSYLLSV